MVDRLVTGPQRIAELAAMEEKVATFDQWLADLQEDYRRAEATSASGEAKAMTLATISGQIQRMKNARSAAMLELAKKRGDIP